MAQLSVGLAGCFVQCPGFLGSYCRKALGASALPQGTVQSWKDVLPLPVPQSVALTIDEFVVRKVVFKKSKQTGNAVQRHYRMVGIDCLSFCMIIGLNCLWSGLRDGARVHGGPIRAAQASALSHVLRAAAYMVDSNDGVSGGVPRSPTFDWKDKIADARVSYHGEVVLKAEALELDRVLASLPPEGFGGIVNILDVCEGEVKEKLMDPSKVVLPEADLPSVIPQPKVRVKDGDWPVLAKALYERGIVAPVSEALHLRNRMVGNGLFGVEKSGKDLPDGRTAQRLIMDLRATNSVLQVIAGDIKGLSGAAAFTTISLEKGQVISISGDDLVSSFYLFRLPEVWLPYMAFERPIDWRSLGVDRDGSTILAACVLPMGFTSSVGIMQHIHRRLALWDPAHGAGLPSLLEVRKDREWPEVTEEAPAWCLYLDDSTILRKVQAEVAIRLAGKPQQEQERLRRAYAFWGIPYNSKKAIEECECAERLGAFLDGKAGRIGVTVRRYLESLSLGLWVLQSRFVSRKALQVFAGKEVHCLQFRRPLFSVYDEIWKLIAGPSDFPQVTPKLILEVLISLGLGPMRFTDWRAKIDPKVMASDASERGGGFVMANRITALGKNALETAKRGGLSGYSGVIVFDFFSGIGGLLRALDRTGLEFEHHVVVEQDKACRRLIRRTWPGGSEYSDIRKLTESCLVKEIERVEKPLLVIAGGGSPCQGLSQLSSERRHFADERSALFYDFADRLQDLKLICKRRRIAFLGFVENVVMDESDRNDISYKLGWAPSLIESGDISRVRRPRLYWISEDIPDMPWFEVMRTDVASRVKMYGEVEPTPLWLPPGFEWPCEEAGVKFPTFTRPIPRRKPPPDPAGFRTSSREALARWEDDKFRLPPYTYEEPYLLKNPQGELVKLPAVAREALMGFPKNHTLKLDREMFRKTGVVDAEDRRLSAIGNSFHTTTVALVLGSISFQDGFFGWSPRTR